MKLFTYIIICILVPFATIAQQHPQHPQHQHEGASHHHHTHDLSKVPMIRWKFYGGIGSAAYLGEVTGKELTGPSSILKTAKPKFSFTGGVAYKINDHFFIRAELGYYKIKAIESSEMAAKRGPDGRRYCFKANNLDFAVMGQFNFLPYKYLVEKGLRLVPYTILGVGFTTSNPRALVGKNGWKKVEELSNGQYKNKPQVIIPVGLGVTYRVNAQLDIGLEGTLRYTIGKGSLDGDSKHGINTTTLPQNDKTVWSYHYETNAPIVLTDHPKYHDMYAIVQIRLAYTFIPQKYKQLFHEQDINSGGNYNHHLRVHE
jgi:opacity protein-like surface antigen